jgi:predicted glycoside hydrolase/deacetylase ChbG (UPF0249 family)
LRTYRVILNADDFGLTEGVCAGIVEAIRRGCVTATTAMAATPGAGERLTVWAPQIAGNIGAHLQLTSGTPVSKVERVPSLVGENGAFPASKKDLHGAVAAEIVREWHAQIEILLGLGIPLSHLDTHHHVHRFPHIFAAFLEIATYYKAPARSLDPDMTEALRSAGVPCVDRTLVDWYGGDLSESRLFTILNEGLAGLPPSSTIELMCHPGWVDTSLPRVSKYVEDRERELRVLADPGVKDRLVAAGFELCSFRESQDVSR